MQINTYNARLEYLCLHIIGVICNQMCTGQSNRSEVGYMYMYVYIYMYTQ